MPGFAGLILRFHWVVRVAVRERVVTSLLSVVLAAAPLTAHSGGPARTRAPAGQGSRAAVQAAPVNAALPTVQAAQASVRLLTGGGFGTTGWYLGYEYPGNTTADPSLAATATRFVLATNSDVYVQVISNGPDEGDVIGHVQLHTLFDVPASDEVIQPHVVYDQAVHRFFLSVLEVDLDPAGAPVASRIWLAYSADGVTWTPAPLTAVSTVILYDQPIIAADSDKVVVAFTARPIGGGTGSGEIKVIQKSDLVSSGVVHQVTLTGPAVPAELAPAVTVTSSDTLWLVADQQTQAALVALTGTPDQGNVATKDFTVPIIPIVPPPAPVQPNGKTVPIPPPRFVTAMWRSGTLWTTTVDGCTPAGSATPRSCLRLLAFNAPDPPATPASTHDFDIGDSTMDYYAPAVATDGYGDVVVAAAESNSFTDPTTALFGERPPFTAVTGFAHNFVRQYAEYNGPDWGGYSAVAIDPADPASVWTDTQEQLSGGGDLTEPDWNTLGVRALASTPKSWPGSTPAFGTRYDQTATLIYRRADGKLEWLQSPGPCPNCWGQAQYFTPSGGTNAAPALDPQLASGFEYLFTRRADDHIWWDDSLVGGTWYDLGGYATSAPAAITAAGSCALALFVRGGNGAVYRKVKSASGTAWTSWQSLGGSLGAGTQPGAATYGNSHEAVFVRGTDNRVYWKHSSNCGATWSSWASLGGQTYSNPAASSAQAGTIDLFVRGTDNALYTRHFNGSSWSGWTALGGSLTSGPAAAIPQIQTDFTTSVPWGTEVIAVGPDQHLWADLKPVGGSWTGWHHLYSQASP
jgi:hypothetical protein